MATHRTPAGSLATARDRVRGRRRELVDDRDAIDRFCRRVEALSVVDTGPALAPDADCAAVVRAGDDELAAVRPAFEETVMAVPHYAERYGDPFTERLATELGPGVVGDLRRATALTPRLRARVVDAASAAHGRRVDHIAALDDEEAHLDRVETVVHDVLNALAAVDAGATDAADRVARVEKRCAALAADRRATRERDDARRGLLADVYADLSVADPVLATVETVESLVAEHRPAGR